MKPALVLAFLLTACTHPASEPEEDNDPYFSICAISAPEETSCLFLRRAIEAQNESNKDIVIEDYVSHCTSFVYQCGMVRTSW